jgi:hypothetical protein
MSYRFCKAGKGKISFPKSRTLKCFQLCIPRTDEFLCAYADESMCCMMVGCMAVQVDEECLFNKTSPMHVTNVDG